MRFRAVHLNWRFGVQLNWGKSIRGGGTSGVAPDVVSIADTAALRCRARHFWLRQKLLLNATAFRFQTVHRTVWNCSCVTALHSRPPKRYTFCLFGVMIDFEKNNLTHHPSRRDRMLKPNLLSRRSDRAITPRSAHKICHIIQHDRFYRVTILLQ